MQRNMSAALWGRPSPPRWPCRCRLAPVTFCGILPLRPPYMSRGRSGGCGASVLAGFEHVSLVRSATLRSALLSSVQGKISMDPENVMDCLVIPEENGCRSLETMGKTDFTRGKFPGPGKIRTPDPRLGKALCVNLVEEFFSCVVVDSSLYLSLC